MRSSDKHSAGLPRKVRAGRGHYQRGPLFDMETECGIAMVRANRSTPEYCGRSHCAQRGTARQVRCRPGTAGTVKSRARVTASIDAEAVHASETAPEDVTPFSSECLAPRNFVSAVRGVVSRDTFARLFRSVRGG